jgi:hypothetical protein
MFITASLGVLGEGDPAITGMAMQYAFQVRTVVLLFQHA